MVANTCKMATGDDDGWQARNHNSKCWAKPEASDGACGGEIQIKLDMPGSKTKIVKGTLASKENRKRFDKRRWLAKPIPKRWNAQPSSTVSVRDDGQTQGFKTSCFRCGIMEGKPIRASRVAAAPQ